MAPATRSNSEVPCVAALRAACRRGERGSPFRLHPSPSAVQLRQATSSIASSTSFRCSSGSAQRDGCATTSGASATRRAMIASRLGKRAESPVSTRTHGDRGLCKARDMPSSSFRELPCACSGQGRERRGGETSRQLCWHLPATLPAVRAPADVDVHCPLAHCSPTWMHCSEKRAPISAVVGFVKRSDCEQRRPGTSST